MEKEYYVHVTQINSYIVKADSKDKAEELVLEGIQEGRVDGDLINQEEVSVSSAEV